MAWEIESQHLDLAVGEHVTVFVERSVKTAAGEPARHLLQIRLGDEITPDEKGVLRTREGEVYDHKARQQEILAELDRRHRHARAFADRHKIPILKGDQ